jgi:hypothetical protein
MVCLVFLFWFCGRRLAAFHPTRHELLLHIAQFSVCLTLGEGSTAGPQAIRKSEGGVLTGLRDGQDMEGELDARLSTYALILLILFILSDFLPSRSLRSLRDLFQTGDDWIAFERVATRRTLSDVLRLRLPEFEVAG